MIDFLFLFLLFSVSTNGNLNNSIIANNNNNNGGGGVNMANILNGRMMADSYNDLANNDDDLDDEREMIVDDNQGGHGVGGGGDDDDQDSDVDGLFSGFYN